MTVSPISPPDAVFLWRAAADPLTLAQNVDGTFSGLGADLLIDVDADAAGRRFRLAADGPVSRVALRWNRGVAEGSLLFGDAWERSYGDLSWSTIRPDRLLPWYWLGTGPQGLTAGAGVRVRPGAWCSWTVDTTGITLWCDVRAGRDPVLLAGRVLELATVCQVRGAPGDTAFAVHRELCAALCSDPLPAPHPLVGSNNWYYAYGVGFDLDAVLGDAALVVRAAGESPERPYCVIDDGWTEPGDTASGGPWDRGHRTFSDMPGVAEQIKRAGARPGLWFRPLLSGLQNSCTRPERLDGNWPMDPSRAETMAIVAADVARFADWGYELVKHDFSTYDVIGRFLSSGGVDQLTPPWSFADRSRTTAEVLIDFYTTIRDAAGPMAIIGCNTVGHLAAGLQHVQRTGDDTSGRQWERTRRMGVNTLAFRLAQHGSFYVVDPDCVASTPATPWDKNAQFLDLVAASGTALFVSVDPTTADERVKADLSRAVQTALAGGAAGGVEPLDWQSTTAPQRWRRGLDTIDYHWEQPWGCDLRLEEI